MLLRRARQGEAGALDDLLARVATKLLPLIRLRMGRGLRGRMESRDILQSVLLKSYQRMDQFEQSDTRSLMAWVARIAENEIRDQHQFHGRQRRDAGRDDGLP